MSQQNRRPAGQTVYPFPIMTANEVMECLHALGIPAQMEDLTKPGSSSTQAIYAQLLDALMAAPMESIDGPKTALLGMMEYKEMYNEALHFTMFYHHCRTLAQLCGIADFAISDMTRPEGARLRICLSGIMNFAKFRDERMHFQNQLQSSVAEQTERSQALRNQLQQVEDDIEEIKARNAAEKPQSEQAQKRNDGIRSELLELRAQQVKLSQEVEDLKRERQDLMDQAAHNGHLNAQLTAQITETRSRLVQSPERIKNHISTMTERVAAEKTRLAGFQQQLRDLANRLEVIGSLERDLQGLIDLEKGIQDNQTKLEEAKRARSAMQAKFEGAQIELRSIEAKAEQLKAQIKYGEDKVNRLSEQKADMDRIGKEKIERLKTDYKLRNKERGAWQKQRDVLAAEQKELENEMNNFKAVHEAEFNELLREYWSMRAQAEEYMNTMTDKLGLQLRA